MPKAATPSSRLTPVSQTLFSNSVSTHPNVLKRNQACHQCRKRKLKCDAKRPCSTCVRSHAHAVSHAPAGTQLPSHPECTFDEVAEMPSPPQEAPKSRYEKLENRINELEALLQQKDEESRTRSSASGTSPSLENGAFITDETPPPLAGPTTFDADQTLFHTGWPVNVPGPELLRHLVEVFFAFQPHAGHLIHAGTFMSSLSLPPTHKQFPPAPLLHGICAVASIYTAAVSSPPLPNYNVVDPDELWLAKIRPHDRRQESFAEAQARHCKDRIEDYQKTGENLLQCLQAQICLSWYYWCHAKWVQLFASTATALRSCVPVGFNICPPFHSISKSLRAPSIIPPARTVIEDEMRRNVFWIAYSQERMHGAGNGWALSLDDCDVSQLLPLRKDQFDQGILVTPHDRQWSCSKDLLLTHQDDMTDSFVLYVKGTMLLSRVKSFNTRFRSRYYSGDSAVQPPVGTPPTGQSGDPDPRETPAFLELDHIVNAFRSSFPHHLKDPIVNNVVDTQLYTACLIPHIANILLHEPHADVRRSGCISALKILTASRAILDLIYMVWSTSYDITLLDYFCSFCFYMSGRVLVRFLQAAVDANSQDQISTLRAELEFVRLAISKVGERVPLAFRYARMLEDATIDACGHFSLMPTSTDTSSFVAASTNTTSFVPPSHPEEPRSQPLEPFMYGAPANNELDDSYLEQLNSILGMRPPDATLRQQQASVI